MDSIFAFRRLLLHMTRVVRRLLLVIAALAVVVAVPGRARADGTPCAPLPAKKPVWIDFADGSVPFWQEFAKPGIVAAAANLLYPPKLRAAGAQTVFWDMYLNNRIGQPSKPVDSATAFAKANRLFDSAVASSACSTPYITENELFGASLPVPWSATNTQYRANVLLYLRTLAARGGHPFLLVSSRPYTAGDAGDWWRQVAEVADIVQEVYFPAPAIYGAGPILGNRILRTAFRRAILAYTKIGIPTSKLGIMLGFHTELHQGGREGLKPAQAWFRTVKWQALSARQVGSELQISTIWSWGWANWGTRGLDPDKPAAACVYLWTRNPRLCNGPAMAGEGFVTSRTEGQIRLPGGAYCTVAGRPVSAAGITRLQKLTGDRQLAATALFARAVESRQTPVSAFDVLQAERAVIAQRFGGSAAAYRAALARSGANVSIARGILGDALRRIRVEAGLAGGNPSPAAVASFYEAYPDLLTRPVAAKPSPWWLGGSASGLALSSLAPPPLFRVPTGRLSTVRAFDGSYAVRPLGRTVPLGALPFSRARPGIVAALRTFARGAAFERWTADRQTAALRQTICYRDDLPTPAAVDLSTFLPFLSPTGA
jgi:hypothetical protein